MEISRTNISLLKLVRSIVCSCLLVFITSMKLYAQPPVKKYMVKDNKMCIELSKNILPASLDSFIAQFSLSDLGLMSFIQKNNPDSLKKQGWKVEKNKKGLVSICKSFSPIATINKPTEKAVFTGKNTGSFAALFPAVSSNVLYGYNRFRNKYPFEVKDSVVTFFLKNNVKAKKVMLAGSFNNWEPNVLSMLRTDSGWIAYVKLSPGKYWYKFIIDGNWNLDNDNYLNENDNRGNVNSVYYKTNNNFKLKGYTNARAVYLAGSFNKWNPKQLLMNRTATGWEFPIYLANGTHTYRFNADGNWFIDPSNNNKLPNEFNDFNSVIQVGKGHHFRLDGYTNAKQVFLIGSFNGWRKFELPMNRIAAGWEISYVLGPGNYEYRFVVDGKEMMDPSNPLALNGKNRNSFLVVQPNYTFRLKGHANAKNVYLAGDFSNWSENGLAMKRDGNDWVCSVHLSLGKHLYKFVVDGQWIKDPNNKLWEQNEFGTGNSIVWMEQ